MKGICKLIEVVGVKFKEAGKNYYFSPNGKKIDVGTIVVVETARGIEVGTVTIANREVPENKVVMPLKSVIRIATKEDLKKIEENKQKEKNAFNICIEKIAANKLDMKLVDVEYTFDGSKILFYFTAEGRVDFRELVKDLASVFHTRIELRQIGVRDEAKLLGGLGICGRPFCCKTFLGEFQSVSIKMAKEQGLSLNPTKISGTCGRLMCCLNYEQEAYESLLKTTPKVGASVMTAQGKGTVVEVNLLTGILKVHLDRAAEGVCESYNKRDVKLIKDGKITIDEKEVESLKHLE